MFGIFEYIAIRYHYVIQLKKKRRFWTRKKKKQKKGLSWLRKELKKVQKNCDFQLQGRV